jgi:RNA polymerase sigma-70 factor (ECF subfamily)
VARLRCELAGLPDLYREAVTLCYLDGLRPSEAAEVIEVPPATVRSRLARGLGILRDRLRAE